MDPSPRRQGLNNTFGGFITKTRFITVGLFAFKSGWGGGEGIGAEELGSLLKSHS
jgi:hypothetical protein